MIGPVLLQAVKDQQKEIESLRKDKDDQVACLQKQIEELRSAVRVLAAK